MDDPPPTVLPDQVVTAVDTRGRVLQSCTIHPATRDPVLLPRAGIVLLPALGQLTSGLVAYSTVTGARLWQAPGDLPTRITSLFTARSPIEVDGRYLADGLVQSALPRLKIGLAGR